MYLGTKNDLVSRNLLLIVWPLPSAQESHPSPRSSLSYRFARYASKISEKCLSIQQKVFIDVSITICDKKAVRIFMEN